MVYFSGDGCIDKPLATLWKNHIGTDKPNIVMKVTVCGSGLKAVTKEHGLTEYWANRITYSAADPAYPKVFCWIYRYGIRCRQFNNFCKFAKSFEAHDSK